MEEKMKISREIKQTYAAHRFNAGAVVSPLRLVRRKDPGSPIGRKESGDTEGTLNLPYTRKGP